jgi:hypothetical protein
LPDGPSGIFFGAGLDDPNQLESAHQIALKTHALLRALVSGKRCDGHSIWPSDRRNVLRGVPAAMELERGRVGGDLECELLGP